MVFLGAGLKLLSRQDSEGEQQARSAEQHFPTERLVRCFRLVFLLVSAAQTKNQLHFFTEGSCVP